MMNSKLIKVVHVLYWEDREEIEKYFVRFAPKKIEFASYKKEQV